MSARFQELAWRRTPMGEISLRRRRDPMLEVDVYEVKLDDDFLMSSLFTVAEVELANLGLAQLVTDVPTSLDVVVGGLGLGFTARAVLSDARVASLVVVEALGDVIEWHEQGLLPFAGELTSDSRCRLLAGDFFALVAAGNGFGRGVPDRLHAILVDIDHTPRNVLHPSHAGFYSPDGLRAVASRLHPGGVFALWSDDPPDEDFLAVLGEVFLTSHAAVVTFANPLTHGQSANTVYVAATSG